MKKYLFGLSLCAALLLTGCGGKTLKCTRTEEESGMKMSEEIVAKFKEDKISSIVLNAEIEVPDDMKELMDAFKSSLEEEFKGDNYKDAKVKIETKDNRIIAKVEMDATKLTKEQLEDINLKDTFEEAKKSLEEQGYSCK